MNFSTITKNPRIASILVWGLLAVLSIIFSLIYANLAQDDAYITFRYARNIALGKGFVYNEGEWVLGTSTPLYTSILALISIISKIDIVVVSKIINAMSLWISASLLFELTKIKDRSISFYLALIFITNPFLRYFIGMESYFLLFIFMLSIWAYQKDMKKASAFFIGLLSLVRYEMIILSVIVGVWDYIKIRKPPYWLLFGLIPILPWLFYSTIVFGSPIPLSVSAKLLASRIPFLFGGAFYWYRMINEIPASFVIITFSLVGIFGFLILKQIPFEYAIIALFSILYLCIASITAGSFPWYYAPLVPGFAITVILGVIYFSRFPLVTRLNLAKNQKQNWSNGIQFIAVFFLVAIQLSFWVNDDYLYKNETGDVRYTAYKQVSDWLNTHASEEQSIASFEIGYLGYFTDMKVVDLAGLVTPGLFSWVDDGSAKTLYHSLRLYSPEYVLIPSDNEAQIDIMENARNYHVVKTFMKKYLLYETGFHE